MLVLDLTCLSTSYLPIPYTKTRFKLDLDYILVQIKTKVIWNIKLSIQEHVN